MYVTHISDTPRTLFYTYTYCAPRAAPCTIPSTPEYHSTRARSVRAAIHLRLLVCVTKGPSSMPLLYATLSRCRVVTYSVPFATIKPTCTDTPIQYIMALSSPSRTHHLLIMIFSHCTHPIDIICLVLFTHVRTSRSSIISMYHPTLVSDLEWM
ncbi:hypothetical protein OH76DRAFT_1401948 [Lentinus brumalis]|uniref:Uncharacterized protein n=1 Tax=Lentinus brumalis TaxID=2498619 RepID=A0A371DF73_9APHY|nr:hypothetical protein OH76DRAFT_1401948 [Polyporus brumalis]